MCTFITCTTIKLVHVHIRSVHTTFEGTFVHSYIQYVATYFRTKVHCTVSTYEGTTYISLISISSNVRKYLSTKVPSKVGPTSIQATSGNSTLYTYSTAHCTAVHYYITSCTKYESTLKVQRYCILRKYESIFEGTTVVLS